MNKCAGTVAADNDSSWTFNLETSRTEPEQGFEDLVSRCADLGNGDCPWWQLCETE